MPEVGTINIEPAREVIRRIFLERIVDGKGLVERRPGDRPRPWPTPLAVFELAGKIGATQPGWSDFGMIDMGGATTDFYSHTEAFTGGDSILLRGLHEPLLKRTVEGDLGLRVSAAALWESERAYPDLAASRPSAVRSRRLMPISMRVAASARIAAGKRRGRRVTTR